MRKLFNYYVRLKKQQDRQHNPEVNPSFPIRLLLPLIGFFALIWFLIRVIPKPSRATYPCQRIAFPLASGFVIWLLGVLGALKFLSRAQQLLFKRRTIAASFCLLIAVGILWTSISLTSEKKVRADPPVPNQPIGTAKGIFPGRVVWVHDPNATDWVGPAVYGNYFWQPEHTFQKNVDSMVAKSIREISGGLTDAEAWDTLFRYYNTEHGKGDIGYNAGEKILIKVNMVTCNWKNYSVNTWYNKTKYLDRADTSPQIILAMLRQLVFKAGVNPADIAVGDTLCLFPNQWYDYLVAEFPEVTYFDYQGTQGRTHSVPSTVRQYWSTPDAAGWPADYVPQLYADADYLINMAVLKGHSAGITMCGKNHYGSYNRRPDNSSFYSLHASRAGTGEGNPLSGQYRAMVDMMGHPDVGGKTLLYMIDGLYGGYPWDANPHKLQNAPFNNDWPSSILTSLDPVAIDSVGMDILWEEWPTVVQVGGVDDYLIEAAMADDPPSGTFYDPDGDGTSLQSLGVHERWNNSTDRQYSRNLDPLNGTGIELVYIKMDYHSADINTSGAVDIVDLMQLIEQWLWIGQPGQIPEDLKEDGVVNYEDFSTIAEYWGCGTD